MLIVSKEAVHALSDHELVASAHVIVCKHVELKLPLTRWEQQFCAGVTEAYKLTPLVSWMQRKCLREIVLKIGVVLQLRAEADAALRKAEGLAFADEAQSALVEVFGP